MTASDRLTRIAPFSLFSFVCPSSCHPPSIRPPRTSRPHQQSHSVTPLNSTYPTLTANWCGWGWGAFFVSAAVCVCACVCLSAAANFPYLPVLESGLLQHSAQTKSTGLETGGGRSRDKDSERSYVHVSLIKLNAPLACVLLC